MGTGHRYFVDLRALLKAMPRGTIDMDQIDAHERRYRHQFADPPAIVAPWLLVEQPRLQGSEQDGEGDHYVCRG